MNTTNGGAVATNSISFIFKSNITTGAPVVIVLPLIKARMLVVVVFLLIVWLLLC